MAHDHHAGQLLTRVLAFHHRVLDWALAKPRWVGGMCVLLVLATWGGYQLLGSDMLPEMDEGGFILDYIMPAGSSLTETNRVLEHVERILESIPEVETTSRRTGLQMGLAAVTEANTGDFTVKLKSQRSRSVDDVMEDVRERVKAAEPELDIELTQVLQDNINDLSNAPEPIQIKIFSDDSNLLAQLGPRVGNAIGKVPGVVDVENGIDNTISGPATNFQVDPVLTARLGFTPLEVSEDATAILDGIPIPDPLIANGRPYMIRVRLDDENRGSLDAIENTVFNSSSGHTASLGSLAAIQELPPQNEILRENLQQLITVTGDLEGSDLGGAMTRIQQTVAAMHLPSSVRVVYGGTYEQQQQSFRDLLQVLLLALALVFGVLLAEFRNFPAPIAILSSSVLSASGVIVALLITRTTFNVASFMGLIMVIGIVAKNGILLLDAEERFRARGASASEAMLRAAQRRLRPVAAGLCAGRRLADVAAAGDCGDRGPDSVDGAQPGGDAAGLFSAYPQSGIAAGRSRVALERAWDNRSMPIIESHYPPCVAATRVSKTEPQTSNPRANNVAAVIPNFSTKYMMGRILMPGTPKLIHAVRTPPQSATAGVTIVMTRICVGV